MVPEWSDLAAVTTACTRPSTLRASRRIVACERYFRPGLSETSVGITNKTSVTVPRPAARCKPPCRSEGQSDGACVPGDWNMNGTDTVGLFRPRDATFYLRNTNTAGVADITFSFGGGAWQPIAGNWGLG